MLNDRVSSFVGGLFFVFTFISLDKVMEVFTFGLIGGIAGLMGKKVIEHICERVSEWFKEARLLDKRSMEYQRFWKNTVFIALIWLLMLSVIILIALLIKEEIE